MAMRLAGSYGAWDWPTHRALRALDRIHRGASPRPWWIRSLERLWGFEIDDDRGVPGRDDGGIPRSSPSAAPVVIAGSGVGTDLLPSRRPGPRRPSRAT